MPPVRGMFGSGQPMDHEPTMGQVPSIPPGTPPGGSDSWVSPHHHFSRPQQQQPLQAGGVPKPGGHYIPGRPLSSPRSHAYTSLVGMVMQDGGGGMGGATQLQLLPPVMAPPYQDVSDSDSYASYQPVTSQQGHVEVY